MTVFGQALQSASLRRLAILRYTSRSAVFPISRVVRLPFDSGPFDQSRERRDGPIDDIDDLITTSRLARQES
jgi:hypothetical protein